MAVDIPNYRVIQKLGDGAQSRIFRARCMRTGKDYAVKIVKIVRPEDSSFVDLLRSELTIGSSVDHPVVRKIYELRLLRHRFRVRGAILFMEYVDGMSMRDSDFRFPLDEVLRFFSAAADGLHAMHRAGFVHADLKPGNILVTPDGAVKLIDLGQSAQINEAKPRVQGTIDYMAPEQVERGILDRRTDVFGLGAALHFVTTGKPVSTEMNQTITPYSESLVGKRLSQVRDSALAQLPACVARLIVDACHTDPAQRIPDMPAFIKRISLARTILAKQLAGNGTDAVEADTYDDEEFDDEQGPHALADAPPLHERPAEHDSTPDSV